MARFIRRRLWRGFLLVLVLMGFSFSAAHGQQIHTDWSEPQLLLNMPANDNGTNPIVYTGPSINTHLLYFGRPADDPDGPFALYYARWDDGGWTEPVDVLVTPDNTLPPTLAAVEDSAGYLHVIWNTNAVWHTKVHLQKTSDPKSWQTPIEVYGDKLALEVAAAIDAHDNIHIVVTTRDRTIDHITLASDGAIGQPVLIHQIGDSGYFPYRTSLVATQEGRLLTCWAETAGGAGGARGVWCSDSEDGGVYWDAPEMIASGHRGARLFNFAQKNQLGRVIWGGVGVGGRELQVSEDDGKTWSTPLDLTQGANMSGYTGQVAVMDSAGDMHLLVNPGDGRDVYVRSRNGAWLPNSPTGWQASDWIEMAVAEGNTLVAVYWIPGSIYTSHLVLDAPRVAPRPVAPPADVEPSGSGGQTSATAMATPVLTPAVKPTLRSSVISRDASSLDSQLEAIMLGIVTVVALVLGVVLLQLRRRAS
jgi:hypothetical protein